MRPGDDHRRETVMSIEITGELWLSPVPEKLFVKTEIDLETGICTIL